MNNIVNKLIIVVVLLILMIILCNTKSSLKETYENANFLPGLWNKTGPILNTFPHTGRKTVSNDGIEEIWWHYPSFGVGSYEQLTNNIRYPNNPDIGTCTPSNFCGALYNEKHNKSNIVLPDDPVASGPGARVGYFRGKGPNLLFNE